MDRLHAYNSIILTPAPYTLPGQVSRHVQVSLAPSLLLDFPGPFLNIGPLSWSLLSNF
jgi:hypothetical protein